MTLFSVVARLTKSAEAIREVEHGIATLRSQWQKGRAGNDN
jgi:flagellin-specific chaperone FliS